LTRQRYTLRQLEYFVAVGRTGSISKASEIVRISSPSISAAISQLEQELRVPLFVREHAKGLSLTPPGKRLHSQAQRILDEVERLREIAIDASGNNSGAISIGCIKTIAPLVFTSLRKGFESKYSEIKISQSELDQAQILAAIRTGSLDVALTYDLAIPADLEFDPLVELPPFVVISSSHPFSKMGQLSIEQLVELPMVMLDLPHSADYFLSLFKSLDLAPKVVERTNDMSVLRSLVGNEYGFSILNIPLANSLSPDGKELAFVPLSPKSRPLRLGALTAANMRSINIVRRFIDYASVELEKRTTIEID
jgi:DNA-binding transcriptional LysR family regulator